MRHAARGVIAIRVIRDLIITVLDGQSGSTGSVAAAENILRRQSTYYLLVLVATIEEVLWAGSEISFVPVCSYVRIVDRSTAEKLLGRDKVRFIPFFRRSVWKNRNSSRLPRTLGGDKVHFTPFSR